MRLQKLCPLCKISIPCIILKIIIVFKACIPKCILFLPSCKLWGMFFGFCINFESLICIDAVRQREDRGGIFCLTSLTDNLHFLLPRPKCLEDHYFFFLLFPPFFFGGGGGGGEGAF